MLSEEVALDGIAQIHIVHLDTLLLGASVVVLCLHLHELQMRADIGAETYLLTVGVSVLVGSIHRKVVSIEIGGVVQHVALTINVLNEIVLTGHLQQSKQLLHVGHKLGVCAVHQFHTAHLGECDRLKLIDDTIHAVLFFRLQRYTLLYL